MGLPEIMTELAAAAEAAAAPAAGDGADGEAGEAGDKAAAGKKPAKKTKMEEAAAGTRQITAFFGAA